MHMENVIFKRYEAELASIARLDRCYYLAPCPSRSERAAYAAGVCDVSSTADRVAVHEPASED